jgi:hypothetical protein
LPAAAALTRLLDAFQRKNKWHIRQPEIFIRTKREGEAFLQFFPQDDGIASIRTIEPEQIRSPNGEPVWTFGILTEEDDRERILKYNLMYKGNAGEVTNSEELEPAEVVHIKINVDTAVKRGFSDEWHCRLSAFELGRSVCIIVLWNLQREHDR